MNIQDYNKMQSDVVKNLNSLLGKQIIKIEEKENNPWDRTFIFHFDDGTQLKFGENSYDPLHMKINEKDIF